MRLKPAADPSIFPEIAEWALTSALLLTMGAFLAGFAVHQADLLVSTLITHGHLLG
jgi:hypothetical protein